MSLATKVASTRRICWVGVLDAESFLFQHRYGWAVQQELSAWLGRIMNTWFVAGVRSARYGTPCVGVAIDQGHLERMLRKMGYVEPWVQEIAGGIAPLRYTLYEAGQRRDHIFAGEPLAPPITH